MIKIAGAATAAGLSLEEAYRVTAKARDNVFSIGIALSGCTLPGEENPIFTLPEDEIEFGMGVHGEPESNGKSFKPQTVLSASW